MSSNPETRWTLHLASCQRKKYKYGIGHFQGSRKLWHLLRSDVILVDLLRLDQVGFILDQVGFILDQTSLKRIRLDGSDLIELSFHHDRTWIDVNLPGVLSQFFRPSWRHAADGRVPIRTPCGTFLRQQTSGAPARSCVRPTCRPYRPCCPWPMIQTCPRSCPSWSCPLRTASNTSSKFQAFDDLQKS